MTGVSIPAGRPAIPVLGRRLGRWSVLVGATLIVFGAFVQLKGVNPIAMYRDVWLSTFTNGASVQRIVVRFAPLLLSALAVAVPARAGLINVGGEGQIVIGAVAAGGIGLALDQRLGGAVVLVVMLLGAALAGALWAGIAGLLRITVGVNEAITTLLLNYVAVDVLLYLIYDRWKDANGSGQPASRQLADAARLPLLSGTVVNAGIIIALCALVAVWFALDRTAWGFRLRVVGGNSEAGRRAGLPVTRLLLSALLVGGMLAGIAGMVHFSGTELKLRSGMTMNFGYVGFLASWLALHKPIRVALAAALLAAIALAADSLQIDSGLPAASANVLMAVTLLVVLGRSRMAKAAA